MDDALKAAMESGEALANLLERGGFDDTRLDKAVAEELHGNLRTMITALRSLTSTEMVAMVEAAKEWYAQPYVGGNQKTNLKACDRRQEAVLDAGEHPGRRLSEGK